MADDEIEHIYLDDEPERPKRTQHHPDLHTAVESDEERKKFIRALLGILLIAALLTTVRGWEVRRFLADFMAVFFIGFAAFKFIHIEAFAFAYRAYDLLASRIRPWAYTVPFIEAFMGFWYLLSEAPERLNILALLITGTAGIGAFRAWRQHSSPAHHTSLGGVFRLPLLKITLFEDVVMFALAATLLFI